MTDVKRHERRTPTGGTTTVRHHQRKTPWSSKQADEVTIAVGAFSFTLVMLIIWALTAVMSITAALLSVISAAALGMLGFKMNRRRRARPHKKPTQQPVRSKVQRTIKRRAGIVRHPGDALRKWTIHKIKAALGRADVAIAGKQNPRRTK